jgi:hypothetical protein
MPPCSCINEIYEKWSTLADFFPILGLFAGFSMYIINFAGRIIAKLRREGRGGTIFFSVHRSSFRVQRSSVGYGVAQKCAACVALRVQRSSDRLQRS